MSWRNTGKTDFHILMPTLDESAAQNDIERILLEELKESYRIYEKCQERRSLLNLEIKNAKGDHLRCLKEILHRTIELINIEDRTIVALKNEPTIKNIYEREKAKLLNDSRTTKRPWIRGTK